MKAYVYLWHSLARFFLECVMFQTKIVEKIRTNTSFSVFFFSTEKRVFMEKYSAARQATDYNKIRRMAFACCIIIIQTHTQNI